MALPGIDGESQGRPTLRFEAVEVAAFPDEKVDEAVVAELGGEPGWYRRGCLISTVVRQALLRFPESRFPEKVFSQKQKKFLINQTGKSENMALDSLRLVRVGF